MDTREYSKIQSASKKNWMVRAYLDGHFSTDKTDWCTWVFRQIAFPPCAKVLELGCGQAGIWTHNAPGMPKDASIILSDFSQGTLNSARKALGPWESRFKFSVVNAEQIPFADAMFDIVIANRMLYFTDLKKTLVEISRVLKPGGKLYAATVGSKNMREILELYFDFFSVQNRERKTVADIFGLDNGAGILQAHFSSVEIRRFANELVVTESEPLVEYIRTAQSIDKSHLTSGGVRKLRNHISGILRRQGHIRITKDTGLFIAEK